jgi:hypothetical protein
LRGCLDRRGPFDWAARKQFFQCAFGIFRYVLERFASELDPSPRIQFERRRKITTLKRHLSTKGEVKADASAEDVGFW